MIPVVHHLSFMTWQKWILLKSPLPEWLPLLDISLQMTSKIVFHFNISSTWSISPNWTDCKWDQLSQHKKISCICRKWIMFALHSCTLYLFDLSAENTISIFNKQTYCCCLLLNKQCKTNRESHSGKGLFKSIHFLNPLMKGWWCS